MSYGHQRRVSPGAARILSASLALAGGLTASHASARADLRTQTQMFVERVHTDINGRPRRILASADRLASGDRLILVVNWRNEGVAPVRGVAVTRSIPRGARLIAPDRTAELSVDGGQTWGRLEELWLPTPLGGVRRALPTDVTHIRWTIPAQISPGATGRLSYRATVR